MKDEFNNLHKFIANNYDLEELEAKLNKFNPLKILKMDHYEIRHSNIISWLLTPNENHNLGSSFVKKFLAEVIINNENLETPLTVFSTQEMTYNDFEIRREWNNIDIFIVSHSNKLCIIIENKIHSKESKEQLGKYYYTTKKEYADYDIIPVFLSIEETLPSDDRYGVISYAQILFMLKFITSIRKEDIGNKVYDFINYYIRTLEVLTMEDEKIKQLCKKIYKDHKEALDLIYGHIEGDDFESSAREFILSIDAKELYIRGRVAHFIPKELQALLGKVGDETWCENYPLSFWFMAQEEKLGIIIEVRPFVSSSLRCDFLKHLKKYEFTIHDRAFKPGVKYTRIFTRYPKFEDWDNKESIIQKMDDLYNTTCKKVKGNLINAAKDFEWDKV